MAFEKTQHEGSPVNHFSYPQALCTTAKMADNVNLSQKRQRKVKYPEMEEALAESFHANQDRVNMSGDLLKESARKILDRLHPDHATFEFINGWLSSFKARHGIRSYRRFGESGPVNMALIEKERPKIREVLDKYALADVYNMDETGLFYRMQVQFDSLHDLYYDTL